MNSVHRQIQRFTSAQFNQTQFTTVDLVSISLIKMLVIRVVAQQICSICIGQQQTGFLDALVDAWQRLLS